MQQLLNNIKAAVALLLLDKGISIGLYLLAIIFATFLLNNLDPATDQVAVANRMLATFIILIFNYSAIIHRLYSINTGNKLPIFNCYYQAFRRVPFLLLLILIFAAIMVFAVMYPASLLLSVVAKVFSNDQLIFILTLILLLGFAMVSVTMTYFIGVLVISKELSPFQAIKANLQVTKSISPIQLGFIITIHLVPFVINLLFKTNSIFILLFSAMWFLLFYCSLSVVLFSRLAESKTNILVT